MLRISRVFGLLIAATVLSCGALIYSLVIAGSASDAIRDANSRKYQSYLLADELRQSSDDLTRLGRTYVVTGDASFKQQYMDILDIRDGKKPRPRDYHRVYWDFVAAGIAQPRPAGAAAPLLDLMKQTGFTEAEFAKLQQAKANSDGLVGLEVEAMSLVEGKRSGGKATPADEAKARELLHSPLYHQYKAKIMTPVDEFFALLEHRTQAEVEAAAAASDKAQTMARLSAGVLALLVLVSGAFVAIRVLGGLDGLAASMKGIVEGDLSVQVKGAGRTDEIGDMAGHLQVFKENAQRMRKLEAGERAARDRQDSELKAARSAALGKIMQDVGSVVSAAADGDFTARIAVNEVDADLRELVLGINRINQTVDEATSDFVQALTAISAGDLTRSIDTAYRGRFEELKDAVNATVTQLADTVMVIQRSASEVTAAAGEINSGAKDLSARTEDQASSLEETAATTEQLAASVKASAASARHAAEMAREATDVASTGGRIVRDAVDAMGRIEDASRKISDISSVIDDIAFQTNLLALNAAVEAARAGEAGKGFAVVASEVRTLAQRSSEAAKDINALIASTSQEVTQGVEMVRSAGAALEQIVGASEKVSATVNEISAATAEQANGIDEMSQAVATLDQTTQQNAALAEESSASADSLLTEIRNLNDVVAVFRTGRPAVRAADDARRPGAPVRRRRAA
ncbi:methyl-accepting chemotaxis protein [Alsobacter sp. KACC 23698]|uniref:Methyl-accepting chemotaxis protein n=1 Tax=Alsobacter sp. KACC 23698 TaxID=3149229 RepID=A0AAU7JM32_9HYPH